LTQHFKSKGEIIYFEDNILDFLRSRVQEQEYESIFAMYTHLFTEKERDTFVATVESLRKNNYNVVGCAKELFVHRNTVVFRLNKIRDLLKIDPMSSAENREFLNELSYYFRKFAK
jgi:carbohydrate diacid regulator